VFDRLEKVDKRLVARIDVFNRLERLASQRHVD
jgi:hypothetical protein